MSEDTKVEERKVRMTLDFASLSRLITKDLNKTQTGTTLLKKYSKTDLINFLTDPAKFTKQLREISNTMYHQSSHYKRLVKHFASMLTMDYVVSPVGAIIDESKKDKILKGYKNALDLLEVINLKHEMQKILVSVVREDSFYGYHIMTKESSMIMKLDPDYCQISSIEDGVYNYAFDFAWFDRNLDKLEMYPPEFQSHYKEYVNSGKKIRWIELSSDATICLKMNEDFEYPVPYFAGIFEDIFDIRDYKTLKKTKEKIGNYKLLVQTIPMRKDSTDNNDYTITFDNVMFFHNRIADALPDEVGVITSPMEIDEVSFKQDTTESDKVAEATSGLYGGAGTSQLLFNSEKAGAIGLEKSINTDESIMFCMLRQIERWINRKLKNLSGSVKFKVIMPDLTIFNRDTMFEKYMKGAEMGISGSKSFAVASLGMSPSDMINLSVLENDILDLTSRFIPLASAHTGGLTEDGRPPKKAGELKPEGTRARDKETNKGR